MELWLSFTNPSLCLSVCPVLLPHSNVWSVFQATDARRAFPCWDEPAVKVTLDVTLVVPRDRVALSNMVSPWEAVLGFPSCTALTHWGRVMHVCVIEPDHHWFREWLVACSEPSHYLNQYWFIVNWTPRNKLQWNFNWTLNVSSAKCQPSCLDLILGTISWMIFP